MNDAAIHETDVDPRLAEVQRALEAKMIPRFQCLPAQRAAILLDALPGSIRIGPHDFRVVKISEFNNESRYGLLDFRAFEIRVGPHSSPTNLADTLLHECMHGFWRLAGYDKEASEEMLVTSFATALVGLFRDNDWLAGWLAGAVK